MSVRRKLFFAMAFFIVGMGLVFAFVTQIVLKDTLHLMVESGKKIEIGEWSGPLTEFYESNGRSWEGIQTYADVSMRKDKLAERSASIALLSQNKQTLLFFGDAEYNLVKRFGIESRLFADGNWIGSLYYYDKDADFTTKLRIGILDSTRVLLIIGTLGFVIISLLLAFWLSRRLTAPLRSLIPAIDRLAKGDYGIQTPVLSKDEYGKAAAAFNQMSVQLKQLEEARRNLVADVAHELRTPITIVRGKLELIQQHGQQIAPESLLPLQDELIRLTRLVDELHQLSLAEAKKLPLDRKPTDIHALLKRIVEHIAPDADNKNIRIELNCSSDTVTANVDSNRIKQVFLNLLVNAVRYTPENGLVRLSISAENRKRNKPGGNLLVSVSDTGAGIAPEHLPFLFNRFYRTDEARDRNSGGMGLGLAIAKEFISAHGGSIEVDSKPGNGTTFTVSLPIFSYS